MTATVFSVDALANVVATALFVAVLVLALVVAHRTKGSVLIACIAVGLVAWAVVA